MSSRWTLLIVAILGMAAATRVSQAVAESYVVSAFYDSAAHDSSRATFGRHGILFWSPTMRGSMRGGVARFRPEFIIPTTRPSSFR